MRWLALFSPQSFITQLFQSARVIFLVLYFLLPWSGYTTSIQPQTIAYFGVVMIGLSGIAVPLVIMERDPSLSPFREGLGPGRFYDIAGFVEQGRWARFTPPFFDQPGPVFELDSIGCCYLVNAELYHYGARHELDPASAAFVAENRVWEEDSIRQNQRGPANSFSDHYSVCLFARKCQLPVRAFADLIAYHQRA